MRNYIKTLRFQELSIKTWLGEMEDIYNIFINSEVEVQSARDFIGSEIVQIKKRRFEYLSQRVYNLCIAYFESKKLPIYIYRFDEKIRSYLSDQKKLFSSYAEFPGDEQSAVVRMFWQFLNSFPEFGSVEEKLAIDYLYNLLKSTSVILNISGVKPESEAQVYKAVEKFCKILLSDGQFAPAAINQTAKKYRPDILVPSLNCAIEYKYAETEEILYKTIDEILEDVQGYNNDPIYTNFFAVFYITSAFITEDRFNTIWEEKNFPKNWEGILVFGS
jgi:hypothetical protein